MKVFTWIIVAAAFVVAGSFVATMASQDEYVDVR